MVFSTSKFESLSIRPPTPPKDFEDSDKDADDTLEFLQDPFGTKSSPPKPTLAKALLNTPIQSPSSDINIPSSSGGSQKRVNFELQTCTIPHSTVSAQSWTPANSSPLRPIPQTRVSKPLKSILKAFDPASTPPPTDEGAAAHQFKAFPEMLDSLVKMLAQGARSSRLDAYHQLHRTMEAYNQLPDDQALKHKMPLLTQFIQRDIQAASPTGTGLDSQLISQASKFLMALFRVPAVLSAMDDDFCSFIVDRIIQVAGDASMPKTVVNTHLAVLMSQTFRPRTITPARMDKILDVLDTIHDRVSGFSVVAYRIRIYRKLIVQRPEIMAKHTERWFKLVVRALLSPQKDINQSARDTIMMATKTIGSDRQLAKAVLSVLNRPRSDGHTFGKAFAKELEKMLSTENASIVPQIWASVTGLLRDSLQPILFPALGDWLKVFEKCLESDKEPVKVAANVAFSFLVYAVNINYETPDTWSKMFLNIPVHQMQRRKGSGSGLLKKSERDAATSGYMTLIYYALRPTASHEQLDRYWAEFVAGFWNPLVHSSSPVQAVAACRLVSALLKGCRRPWNEQRALELKTEHMIRREELPLLDPKWVRKSISTILKFIDNLLDATPWSERGMEDEPVKTMWLSLLDSLVEASSKEIMASTETKDAMAHIVNLLRRVWDRHTTKLALSQQKEEDIWANKFCFLTETVIQKLGALQFSDKCLSRNGRDEFEVAPTPSHRSRSTGPRTSPLLYFIDLLVKQSEGKLSDEARLRAMELLLQPCLDAHNTRFSKLEILRDCSAAVDCSSRTTVALRFWGQIATLTNACLQEQTFDSNERIERQLGKEYAVIVNILEYGSACFLDQSQGQEVLYSFVDVVRREAGEGALVLAVVERVSECIMKVNAEEDKTIYLPYASTLLRSLPKTMNRRILDHGRQKLWPSSPSVGRNSDFDPYNHLYGAINSIGLAAYSRLNVEAVESTKNFLGALAMSIRNCSTSLLAVYLRKVQEVVRIWVEDAETKLQHKDQYTKSLHQEVVALWKEVSGALERLPRKDGQILLHLEPLITAGFVSKRRSILNISITTWNSTFGKEESLRYPPRLEQALRQLQSTVEISLPSLEIREDDHNEELSLYDSDSSVPSTVPNTRSPRFKESPFRITRSARKSNSPATSGSASRKRSTRQAAKVRLRHDNSQIHFEPIISSPTNPFVQESQILTERQKEMIEHQRLTNNIFANIGASHQDSAPSVSSPSQLHSDAVSADDLPTENCRTPLKSLAAMGPMDVYLGSSPTPHARKSTKRIVSDETSVATPTTVKTAQPEEAELGSSPPRFDKSSQSISFDEGTTLDEDALPDVSQHPSDNTEDRLDEDSDLSDAPSSTIELQLTAQFDADIKAQRQQSQEPDNLQGDACDESVPDDAEVPESQPPTQPDNINWGTDGVNELELSSSSRVRDSFRMDATASTPKPHNLRRSTRHSGVSSPALSSPAELSSNIKKKRKQTLADNEVKIKKSKKEEVEEVPQPEPIQPEDGILENIVVASSPMTRKEKGRKRKSTEAMVPEVSLRRSVRRSASLLSQVESHVEEAMEDIPVSKRTRQDLNQDVSKAKNSSHSSQAKQLRHVRVTPKRSCKSSSVPRSSIELENEAGVNQTLSLDIHPTSEQNKDITQELASHEVDSEPSQSQQPSTVVNTPNRSFAERVILTPRSILSRLVEFKDYLASVPQLMLGRAEEREFNNTIHDIRTYVNEAGRRHETGQ